MITIQKIKLNELEEFVNSRKYLMLIDKPISLLRMKSYINNPNGNEDDIVLFMAFFNSDLVGYKTVFSDTFSYNYCKIKFGWLSGTWTHENYRRKGVSSLLLNEVFNDWKGKLMFTNYAEESKAVYDKTEKFTLIKSLEGYRHYIRFSLKELLPPKSDYFKKSIKALDLIDISLNSIFDLRFKFFKLKRNSLFEIEKLQKWDNEVLSFLDIFKRKELFQRNQEVYDWVKNHPWIKTDIETKEMSQQYYFSNYSGMFSSNWYKIYDNTQNIVGVVLITINNKHLKLPYIYTISEALPCLQNLVINLCIEWNISYLTIYDLELNKLILQQKFFKITRKLFKQNYFVSKKLLFESPNITNFEIQSGDGDVVFT